MSWKHTPRAVRLWTISFLLALQAAVCWGADGNPIIAENQLAGSSDWQSTNPGNDTDLQIKGYASAMSVNHGEAIDFHISVKPAQSYSIQIYRLGYYGGLGGRLMQTIGPLAGSTQPTCPTNATTGMISCAWPVSYSLTVLSDWVTGVYVAKLIRQDGYENYITFVVRDDSRNPDLIFQSSVTTYHAYNNFPNDHATGKSAYDSNSFGANTLKGTPVAVELSFDRPYPNDGSGEVFNWEHDLLRFLEKEGYDVSYTTDIDTHAHPERLLDVKGFLSTGHDEYWSGAMRDGVEAARAAGVNLAFFGANAGYWQIRLRPSAGGVPNRVMEIYKEANLDPEPDPVKKTVKFRNLGRAEQQLVGVQYVDYNQWNMNTPFVVEDNTHWIYDNTAGLGHGASIPGLMGYEVDTRFPEYPLPDSVSYTVLGRSPYSGINGNVMAETVIYETPLGSHVFASGTICWSWGLNKPGYVNENLRTMTRNLLNRFLVDPAAAPTAPVVTNPGTRITQVGSVVSLTITATDPQHDPLTFSAEGLPAGLGIASTTGVISGTETAAGIGSHIVSVHVSDGTQTTTINFIWKVTASPELANCGTPVYNPSTGDNLYLWKECGSDQWHVLLNSADSSYVQFSGTIESTAGFVSVTQVGVESSDTVNTSNPTAIQFSFGTGGGYTDELVFTPQVGTQLCFLGTTPTTPGTQVRVGNGVTPTVPPFDPTTSQGCYPPPNTAPSVTSPGAQSSTEGDVISLTISAHDNEGNELNYTAFGLPPGLDIDADTGVIGGTVAGGSVIPYNVSVYVSDGSLSTTVAFSWTVIRPNTAPSVTPPEAQTSTEGDVISLPISATDNESNPLSYTADGLPPGLDIDADTGVITGTVGGSSGSPYSVSVHVYDGSLTTTVQFLWTINAPNTAPQVTNPGTQTSTAGDVISLPIGATDNENNPLSYTADGLPPGLSIVPGTNVIAGTVGGASATPYDVSVHVYDGSLTTTVDFTWTVSPNAAPIVSDPGAQTFTEGDVVSVGILASDDGGNALSYTADNLPTGLNIDAGSGVISGTVSSGSAGPYNASVHVYDGSLTTTVQFLWTINAPNTAPQVTNPGTQTSTEGDVISLPIGATDNENNPLSYTADGLPPGLSIVPGTNVIAGTVGGASATPYDVSVHVYDGSLTTTVDFTWTVSPNAAPIVSDPGAQTFTEGDVVSVGILASDDGGNALSYTADNLPTGLNIDAGSGVISGTVSSGSAGPYNASVHVYDGSLTTTVQFLWTINAPNTAPQVTNPGTQTSTEGDVISLPIGATDNENNPLSYTADGLPPGLSIVPGTNVITGTVGGSSGSPYSVSVHVYDGSLTTTVDFTWTVHAGIQPDGDLNEDGLVNAADVLLAQRALLGEITLTTDQMLHADVAPLQSGSPSPDGQFNLGDVLVIERKVLDLISF